MDLSQYKDSLGQPRQGFHAARVPLLDVALWDTVGTIVIAICIALLFRVSIWKTVVAAFVLGTLMHIAFGVRTRLTTAIVDQK